MDPPSTNKRKPSRCREWERQRRLKFNDAISKLGEIVKTINKANCNNGEETDVQYPKIEIVQKAIICLTNCVQEKTQLKAEILALEVKLEAIEKQKQNKIDVSVQVTLGATKKNQNNKYVKLMMLQKSKRETKGKDKIMTNKKNTNDDKKTLPKLPKLLPLTNVKKENTIVMLPATPYIFPQRPMLFPQPPTIVLVDTNLQPLNKQTTIPIINRNTNNDITKTTMVNVLPISAYSHPLSASKTKKNTKPRSTTAKKSVKKVKTPEKPEENLKPNTDKVITKENENEPTKSNENVDATEVVIETIEKTETSVIKDPNNSKENSKSNDKKDDTNKQEKHKKETENTSTTVIDISKRTELPIDKPSEQNESIQKASDEISNESIKCNKLPPDKTENIDLKTKDNKIPAILESTICENVVDGGNARLELAEEFLAASPTAAFLMSFPLVSGNRADSPADEVQSTSNTKEIIRRTELTPQQIPYYDKPSSPENKTKTLSKNENAASSNSANKSCEQQKYQSNNKTVVKTTTSVPQITNDNPFLNLSLPSIISSSCNLTDSTFGLDFDCNINKTSSVNQTSQSTSYSNANSFFYKGDPFNTVKSTIYSTSSISSGHEFNSLGLYPCAVENYSSKNKTEFSNVEDNLMKISSSRLTYDIDLGWSHKGFDFVNCTTSANTFHKDSMLTTAPTPFSTTYNPFNPEFHVPLVPNSNKKNQTSKSSGFPEQITSFYSQGTNLWHEDVSSIYTNSNASKNFISKQQNYFPSDQSQTNSNLKTTKHFDTKQQVSENVTESVLKPSSVSHHVNDKYVKKSPSKMHINWMTSEIRPMQNNSNQTLSEIKETVKAPYSQIDHVPKKQSQSDSNYFPINMHHFPTQTNHEEINVWPAARPAGTTEISIDPPPINLPTLVGDLALGPHDRKKGDILNRGLPHPDLQNCGNFLSVTQLMNRSSENMPPRSNAPIPDIHKSISTKQNITHGTNEVHRKAMASRLESHPQFFYGFNDSKVSNVCENMNQYVQTKSKSSKADKNSKTQKNSYSAESLIRGGTNCNQKIQDSGSVKFMMPSQKFTEFNLAQDTGVAQVSHFPPILDYSENSYTGQQFSGTTLYNSTTNTISNSFYSNFMPTSSNLMSSNYAGGAFPSDFVDYNQTGECNYGNHKYSENKMRNSSTTYLQDKESSTYKSSRRETAVKHKLECSKKDSNKKYQSKRPKVGNEVEEWNDPSHLLWQNKNANKRHQNSAAEELPFPNYVGNQMPTQYQPDFFNSHIMSANMQNVGPNTDRSLASFPVASRSNFNLSALFPEITMKVQ